MAYTTEEAAKQVGINLNAVGSISRTGSVLGMQRQFGWTKGGQVRIGSYVYNVGTDAVQRLRHCGLLKG